MATRRDGRDLAVIALRRKMQSMESQIVEDACRTGFIVSEQEISNIVWKIANDSAQRGPGWAQEGVVLREIGDQLAQHDGGRLDQQTEQLILNAWHDLFLEKKLAWGYNLDNPNSPFFHVR